MASPAPSLRERRREETWKALHDAASSAVLDGTDSSVEAIATAAGVSVRTFFNYFGSKDEAVFGYRAPHLPDGALADLRTHGEPVEQATRLLLATMRTATPYGTPARRKRLTAMDPALGRFRMLALASAEELVVAALVATFGDSPRLASAPGGPERTVRMWVSLGGAVLRHAAGDPEHPPGTAITDEELGRSLSLYHHLHRSDA